METVKDVSKVATKYGIPMAVGAYGVYMGEDMLTETLKKYKIPLAIVAGAAVTVALSKTGMLDMLEFPK